MRFRFHKNVPAFILILATSFSLEVFAATEEPIARFDGGFSTTGSTPLFVDKDAGSDSMMNFKLDARFSFSNGHRLSLSQEYDWDIRSDEKFQDQSDFSDLTTSYSFRSFKLTRALDVKPRLIAILPVSKNSRIKKEVYSIDGAGLAFSVDPEVLNSKNLGLDFSISILRVFSKFETDIHGSVLNEYSSSQMFTLSYSIGKISLASIFIHKNGLSYQGNLRENFESSQEIAIDLNKATTLAFGHTNSGSALKDNGQDSNIALYSEPGSQLYLQAAVRF